MKYKIVDLLAEGRNSAVSPVDGLKAIYLGHWLEESDCMTLYQHYVLVQKSATTTADEEAIIVELHTGWSYGSNVYPATEEVGGENTTEGSGYERINRTFYQWLPDEGVDAPSPGDVFAAARQYWGEPGSSLQLEDEFEWK